jgi:DNA replication protein DnaC
LLTHPTLDQLHALGLHGMAKAFADIEAGGDAASLGHAEWLALLLEREATLRRDKRLSKRLQYAKLRQQACVEDIDYRTPRGLDRSLLTMLVEGQWIDDHANLLICGPSGVGKSWLASALGNKACRDNRSALYQRVPRLFTDLALARGDGRHRRNSRGGRSHGRYHKPFARHRGPAHCAVGADCAQQFRNPRWGWRDIIKSNRSVCQFRHQ